jgi:hypothetical protein
MPTETKLSVEEGNRLVAEFEKREFIEGVLKINKPDTPTRITFSYDNMGYYIKYGYRPILQYHSDWNWLMPVYIKIVKEELYGENEEAIILFNIMYERLGDGDGIEEVRKYIVQFIQWYNNQQSKP